MTGQLLGETLLYQEAIIVLGTEYLRTRLFKSASRRGYCMHNRASSRSPSSSHSSLRVVSSGIGAGGSGTTSIFAGRGIAARGAVGGGMLVGVGAGGAGGVALIDAGAGGAALIDTGVWLPLPLLVSTWGGPAPSAASSQKLTFEKRTDLDGDQRPQHGSDKRLHHAG
jgi:hypothetical protein